MGLFQRNAGTTVAENGAAIAFVGSDQVGAATEDHVGDAGCGGEAEEFEEGGFVFGFEEEVGWTADAETG